MGLSDGEVMERLWSFLRRFSRMTKEMRPAHRVDVLSHALLYYASLKIDKLGTVEIISYFANLQLHIKSYYYYSANFLVDRWRRATDVQKTASANYQSLVDSSDPSQSRIVYTNIVIMSCLQH